jgi:hypothetical protein
MSDLEKSVAMKLPSVDRGGIMEELDLELAKEIISLVAKDMAGRVERERIDLKTNGWLHKDSDKGMKLAIKIIRSPRKGGE